VRFVCVDLAADASDDTVAASVERARTWAADAGRVLLFSRAASVASRLHRAAGAAREGVWLDAAAHWLLSDDPSTTPAPARPRADVFDERAVAVTSSRSEPLALPCTDRFLELVDGLLVMAVPDDAGVDVVDNAHLWLVGGAPCAVEQRAGGRAIARVGGCVAVIDVLHGEARVAFHPVDQGGVQETTVSLVPSAKMAVRGVAR
jgi:hypothetical protein